MRGKKVIYYICMFLPLVITLAALRYLPDQIPAHYGINNEVTRWGSKYETLFLSLTCIGMGIFLLLMARVAGRQEKHGKNNENICILTGIVTLVLFSCMNIYFLYATFSQTENLLELPMDIGQISCCILGIIMVIIGNVMPKVKMNSIVGLRTTWSMKNDVTWKKSQRFGGISFMIAGILIAVTSVLTEGFLCYVWMTVIVGLLLCVDVYYTYRVARSVID